MASDKEGLEEELEEARSQVGAAQAASDDAAKAQIAALEEKSAALENKLETMASDKEGLEEELEEARSQVGAAQAASDDAAKAQIAALEEKSAALENKLDTMASDKEGLEEELEEARSQVGAAQAASDDATKAQIAALKEATDVAGAHDLEDELESRETEITGKDARIRALEEEVARQHEHQLGNAPGNTAAQEEDDLQQQLEILLSDQEALREELAASRATMLGLEQIAADQEQWFAEERSELEVELESRETEITGKDKRVQDLEDKLETLVGGQASDTSVPVDGLAEENIRLRDRVDALESDNVSLVADQDIMAEDNALLADKLEQLESRLLDLESDGVQSVGSARQPNADSSADITQLALQATMAALSDARVEIKNELQAALFTNTALAETNHDLTTKLAEIKACTGAEHAAASAGTGMEMGQHVDPLVAPDDSALPNRGELVATANSVQKANADLKEQLQAMAIEKQTVEDDLIEARIHTQVLEEDLEHQLETLLEEQECLHTELSVSRATMLDLEQIASNLDNQLDVDKAEIALKLEELQSKFDAVIANNGRLEKELAGTAANLAARDSEILLSEASSRGRAPKKGDASQELSVEAWPDLRQQVHAQLGEIDALKGALNLTVQRAESAAVELETDNLTLMQERTRLQMKIEVLASDNAELQQQTLQGPLVAQDASGLEEQLAAASSSNEKLAAELTDLRGILRHHQLRVIEGKTMPGYQVIPGQDAVRSVIVRGCVPCCHCHRYCIPLQHFVCANNWESVC